MTGLELEREARRPAPCGDRKATFPLLVCDPARVDQPYEEITARIIAELEAGCLPRSASAGLDLLFKVLARTSSTGAIQNRACFN